MDDPRNAAHELQSRQSCGNSCETNGSLKEQAKRKLCCSEAEIQQSKLSSSQIFPELMPGYVNPEDYRAKRLFNYRLGFDSESESPQSFSDSCLEVETARMIAHRGPFLCGAGRPVPRNDLQRLPLGFDSPQIHHSRHEA